MIAGFFVATFMTVEPAFQIILVGGVFDKGQRIEVFRRQVTDDVDAYRFAAVLFFATGFFASMEHRQRQAVNVLVLRADLRIMRMLPLLGLGDEVMFLRRIRGQQGVRLFAAFGKFAITEDKGLSSHNVGKGRLNMSIIVDGELRGNDYTE